MPPVLAVLLGEVAMATDVLSVRAELSTEADLELLQVISPH
jgi:hypothetical protein